MATTAAARRKAVEADTEKLIRSLRELAPAPARRAPRKRPAKRPVARKTAKRQQ